MEKVCVFCGNPPNKKNKEHIIPKWLMKLTGTENKDMSVGSDWIKQEEQIFRFTAFTFPSCTKCNDEFSKVEASVKPIVEAILKDEYVGADELDLLLDWFDKVRISLWLGLQYMNKGTFNLEPKYYINNRVGLKDRLLAITNCYDNYKGIKWTGVNTLGFIVNPTCFTLKINHILFTNCSQDFVVAEQLGFPYPLFERQNPSSKLTDMLIAKGKEKLNAKLFKSKLYYPTTTICQPIFSEGKRILPDSYTSDYVRQNSYDFVKGKGKIFIMHGNLIYPLEIDEEISFEDKNKSAKFFKFNKPTLEFQLELLTTKKFNLDLLNDAEKADHYKSLDVIINYTREQLRQYDY
jgi:hypothetical protein